MRGGGSGLKNVTDAGVWGDSDYGEGVVGTSNHGTGVYGLTNYSDGGLDAGVWGSSTAANYGIGVKGVVTSGANSVAIRGTVMGGGGYAGYFSGRVTVDGPMTVNGYLTKSGGGFTIDHPLAPTTQVLNHSFVESPDMMNIYNGNVTLDANGEALVELPEWFEALNQDFRYQLTAIGAPGPNLYIAEEIQDHHFKIAGGKPGGKVSWQVTGIRHDPWAEQNRPSVEVDKTGEERGTYINPKSYGATVSR